MQKTRRWLTQLGVGRDSLFSILLSLALIRNLFWASLIFEAITINHFLAKKYFVYMKLDLAMI